MLPWKKYWRLVFLRLLHMELFFTVEYITAAKIHSFIVNTWHVQN